MVKVSQENLRDVPFFNFFWAFWRVGKSHSAGKRFCWQPAKLRACKLITSVTPTLACGAKCCEEGALPDEAISRLMGFSSEREIASGQKPPLAKTCLTGEIKLSGG